MSKLRIDGVGRRFGDTVALEPVDLEVEDGSFVSIVGPSGCGKSTLFNIVSGILAPSEGQVWIDGQDVTGTTGHVGYMLQKDLLLPWCTVIENITFGSSLRGRVKPTEFRDAARLAQRYGLGGFVHNYPHTLSGGMRQRVALMRTLAMDNDVMLLDEPFGALDSQTRVEMQQWLLEVWSEHGRTVVFVTHDIDEAIFLADRVVIMSARPGRVREVMPVALPRPRGLETLTSPTFMDLKAHILGLIYENYAGPGAAQVQLGEEAESNAG
ncbi:MAG: ABC transporter ATP-binding protein [Solirubrobacterales bacterium]